MKSRILYDFSQRLQYYLAEFALLNGVSSTLVIILAVIGSVTMKTHNEFINRSLNVVMIYEICVLLVVVLIYVSSAVLKNHYRRLGAREAAQDGNLDDLIHAHYMDCICTQPLTLALAARGGHLQIVKYLRENARCDWNEIACEYATAGGHTETLRYLLDNGCPSNERTCEAAAENGHLDCLVVAHEHGCRWNARTATKAFKSMHYRCFKYAVENGCPNPQVYEDAALILQAWWRDRMYRYGSSFVNTIVKPRFEYNLSLMMA